MGIYDNKRGSGFKFNFAFSKLKYPVLAGIGIIIIVFAFMVFQQLLQPQPITVSINPNPLVLSTSQTTLLTVEVINTTEQDALDSTISVSAVAKEMFVITPSLQEIPTLESNGKRQFVFMIRPFNSKNPNAGVAPGDYKINIVFKINGKEFSKEAVLQIKATQ